MLDKSTRRKKRTRNKLKKISERDRLSVFKSNNHIYAQIIDDKKGITLASASSLEKNYRENKDLTRKDLAKKIGEEIAKRSLAKGIKSISFDKGKYRYHGIIKILAEAARNAGLDF
ncbi:MAG: 50S ribosomal protein L18 [Alphaproteobacteria bacterium MarineAlpha5_Bin9]|nr:MAG: 50S ribosomal protein L18 [Alphaproteobacteria bacterium MarineAlpha5_Bin9]|tara:strand:+ start:5835 stop:6182 length:348 start_codon:yes stop_codon:yes gene_type:complete